MNKMFKQDIVMIKHNVSKLEQEGKRTPVWDYLKNLYQNDKERPDIARLCLHQMMTYLYDLEGDPTFIKCERKNEYDDYYSFIQQILQNRSHYEHDIQFQWELCYYLYCLPIFHFLLGFDITFDNANQLRNSIIEKMKKEKPSCLLFEYIDLIQSFNHEIHLIIPEKELLQIREEIKSWNLQDNSADEELRRTFIELDLL